VAESAYAADLKSAGPQGSWEFKSPQPHQSIMNASVQVHFVLAL
jgi:hypothetical protein